MRGKRRTKRQVSQKDPAKRCTCVRGEEQQQSASARSRKGRQERVEQSHSSSLHHSCPFVVVHRARTPTHWDRRWREGRLTSLVYLPVSTGTTGTSQPRSPPPPNEERWRYCKYWDSLVDCAYGKNQYGESRSRSFFFFSLLDDALNPALPKSHS